MRIRNGIDIVGTDRILRHLEKEDSSFMTRCFTEGEIQRIDKSSSSINRRAESYAACFAAKEAAAKALGTGICTKGIGFTDIEVIKDELGAPQLVFHGEAEKRAREIGAVSAAVSLTHDSGMAVAMCTVLTDEEVG
ncbi:MAG: holo-ACP synthase [Clostridiales bacterium]|nr:holo-ACP synthase [Clostridiales bacterium]